MTFHVQVVFFTFPKIPEGTVRYFGPMIRGPFYSVFAKKKVLSFFYIRTIYTIWPELSSPSRFGIQLGGWYCECDKRRRKMEILASNIVLHCLIQNLWWFLNLFQYWGWRMVIQHWKFHHAFKKPLNFLGKKIFHFT